MVAAFLALDYVLCYICKIKCPIWKLWDFGRCSVITALLIVIQSDKSGGGQTLAAPWVTLDLWEYL
jgi:hypothetical protein